MGFWNYMKWMCIFDLLFRRKKEHAGHISGTKQKDTYVYDPDMQDNCCDCGPHDYGSGDYHDNEDCDYHGYEDSDFHDYEDYGNDGYEEDYYDNCLDDDPDF